MSRTVPQFKIRATLDGGHVRVVMFVRQPPGETWQNCGDFHIDEHQWPTLLGKLQRGHFFSINDRVPKRGTP